MRNITMLIVHCSAVTPSQSSSARQIDEWHRARGNTNGIGYHYVIRRNGHIELGRPECLMGAHVKNHNRYSIGICYEGGLDATGRAADTRTDAQKVSLRTLLEKLHQRYPKAVILGHRDLNPLKACPCFDAAGEYQDLQPQ